MISKKNETTRQNRAIRKGDRVIMVTGNDRGVIGTVLSRTDDRAIVQGINVRKKCIRKGQQNQPGGMINIERAVHISNIKLCNKDDKPIKVKVKEDEKGDRLLVYNQDGQEVLYRSKKKM